MADDPRHASEEVEAEAEAEAEADKQAFLSDVAAVYTLLSHASADGGATGGGEAGGAAGGAAAAVVGSGGVSRRGTFEIRA